MNSMGHHFSQGLSACGLQKTIVIKFDGSVLENADSYGQAPEFLVRRLEQSTEHRFVVVVPGLMSPKSVGKRKRN